MGRLLSAADIFVDRDILRFAGAESVSTLEAEIIEGFLAAKGPPLTKITGLLKEGRLGDLAGLVSRTWARQFGKALRRILKTQIQVAGDLAARKLGRAGFGVEEMITAAAEPPGESLVYKCYSCVVERDEPGTCPGCGYLLREDVDVSLFLPSSSDSRLQFALAAPTFDPTNPLIDGWIESRVSGIIGTLEVDANAAITAAIKRGATDQLDINAVARVIRQHLGLDERRAIAVENHRRWLFELQGRKNLAKIVKERPATIRKRLQRGGFKRKEWRLMGRFGLDSQRIEVMTRDYALRLQKERALGIAQTEIALAKNRGQEFAWEEAQASGALVPGAKRKWITRRDERVCPLCGPMHGQLADIGGVWHTAAGDVETPNHIHPKCRCNEELVAKPARPRKRKPRRRLGPRKKKAAKKAKVSAKGSTPKLKSRSK